MQKIRSRRLFYLCSVGAVDLDPVNVICQNLFVWLVGHHMITIATVGFVLLSIWKNHTHFFPSFVLLITLMRPVIKINHFLDIFVYNVRTLWHPQFNLRCLLFFSFLKLASNLVPLFLLLPSPYYSYLS